MIIFSFSQDKIIDGVSGGALIYSLNLAGPKTYRPARLGAESHLFVEQLKDRLYPLLTWKVGLLMIWDSENFFTTI